MKGSTAPRRKRNLPPTTDLDIVQQQPARASQCQASGSSDRLVEEENLPPCADPTGDVVSPKDARANEANPLDGSEIGSRKHAPEMGMGFFNQLEGLPCDVAPRPKPPDLTQNLGIGFFTRVETQQQESAPKRRRVEAAIPQEESRRVLPVDERVYTMVEFFMVSFLRPITLFPIHSGSFTPFASNFCWIIIVIHTLETLLTNFGPKSKFLHLPFAFIRPLQHFLIDHLLIGSLVLCVLVYPREFGPFPYHKAAVLSLLLVIYHFLCPRTSVCELDRRKLVAERHVSRAKCM